MRSNEQGRPTRRTARDLALLIALTLGIHAPFIHQAFHVDDVQYLDVASNVFRNPLFPLDLQSVFEGKHLTLWAHSHPPLNSYVIAGLLLLNNRAASETFLHTAFLFFPTVITVAFYFLARRFVARPFVATALLATNPILIVCAHTLMTDIPLLAMWLCATTLFVIGISQTRNWMVYLAAMPLTAACFYAYQGFALILLLAFYAMAKRRLGFRETLVLCAPVLFIAAWQLSGYMHRGTMYASAMFEELGRRGWGRAVLKIKAGSSTLAYLGGIAVPFPFIFWRTRGSWKGSLIWLSLAVGVLGAYALPDEYSWPQRAFFAGCFGGGVALVIWTVGPLLTGASQNRLASDDLFLWVWFAGMLITCVTVFLGGVARYLLPAYPALILLFARSDEQTGNSPNRAFYGSLLAVQLVLGLGLAQADYQFAATGRREAYDFQRDYLRNNQPFLFSGEWGFRYYMTALGGKIMAEDVTGFSGELVVKSRLSLGRPFEFDRSLELLEQRTYRIRSPLRLLDVHAHAGFWSDGWGVLPFWFSRETLDEISIYRVKGK